MGSLVHWFMGSWVDGLMGQSPSKHHVEYYPRSQTFVFVLPDLDHSILDAMGGWLGGIGLAFALPWLLLCLALPLLCLGFAFAWPWPSLDFALAWPWLCLGFALAWPWLVIGFALAWHWLGSGLCLAVVLHLNLLGLGLALAWLWFCI